MHTHISNLKGRKVHLLGSFPTYHLSRFFYRSRLQFVGETVNQRLFWALTHTVTLDARVVHIVPTVTWHPLLLFTLGIALHSLLEPQVQQAKESERIR